MQSKQMIVSKRTKLSGRKFISHQGWAEVKYLKNTNQIKNWREVVEWLRESFGNPGKEWAVRKLIHTTTIFFKDQKCLSMFLLKYGSNIHQ